MSKLKNLNLNSLQLKLIGYAMTLFGAVGITFFSGEGQEMTRLILEFISYPAIAIFVFLLVEGYEHTEDRRRYTLQLALTAVAAEPFYDYACIGKWLDFGAANGQNFLFALLMCQLILVFLKTAEQSRKFKCFMVFSLLLAIPFWSALFNVRFSGIAMILTVVFYLLREKTKARDITALAVGTVLKVTGGLSALLIHGYNGERGGYSKHLFYALYPAMWVILSLVKFVIA